ncbi:conserved hypothetical protein [Talaromyces stipitatus ATCC 10500]|uniref:Uncharacterized protein n=1 Tax=Talaromyces stipitatus (strain ATCC 10500 / CBS 375.48 / QM 6759 / NRRL 1006) TaxID=441959 RepID=B8MGL6_TALSN|nr:uncharacterized protein TSTA_018380 [Talaromyces stipitatus ATCC 10500]EED16767.1 conserved hypothetical protein [Talaromyces stipitatus ATCC 10500]
MNGICGPCTLDLHASTNKTLSSGDSSNAQKHERLASRTVKAAAILLNFTSSHLKSPITDRSTSSSSADFLPIPPMRTGNSSITSKPLYVEPLLSIKLMRFRDLTDRSSLLSTRLVLARPVATGDFSASIVTRRAEDSDKGQLPIQIGGIAASYVIFDAIVVFLILFVGRRLRRAAHTSNYSLDMVMLQPYNDPFAQSTDPSPISGYSVDTQFPSPVKPRGWNMSWTSVTKGHKAQGSVTSSVATVDEDVVSADRRRAQEQMEFLYAAVMEHDAKKASAHNSPVMESSTTPIASPKGSPQFAETTTANQYSSFPLQATPLSPRQESVTTNKSRTSKRLSKLSNLSIFSPGLRSSNSNKLKSPRSVRDLPISPPLKSPDPVQTAAVTATAATFQDSAAPMSPRIYNPGPPPTAPLPGTTESNQLPKFTLQPISTPSSMRANAPAPLSINSSNSTLPFRQQFNPPMSAPHTKTTILERPLHVPGGPRTGMPTPYSPYMPFTPVTPLTPSRLVTKRDRKRLDKSNGLKVLHEDDMVKSDEEIWG